VGALTHHHRLCTPTQRPPRPYTHAIHSHSHTRYAAGRPSALHPVAFKLWLAVASSSSHSAPSPLAPRLERTFAGSFSSSDLALKEELERLIRDLHAEPAAQRAAGFRQVEEMLRRLGYPAGELGAVQSHVAAEEERGLGEDGGPAPSDAPSHAPRVVLSPAATVSASLAGPLRRGASGTAPALEMGTELTNGRTERPGELEARGVAESALDMWGDPTYQRLTSGGANAMTTAAPAPATITASVSTPAAMPASVGDEALKFYDPWRGTWDSIRQRLRHLFSRPLDVITGSLQRRRQLGVLARRTLVRWQRQYTPHGEVLEGVCNEAPRESRLPMGLGICRTLSKVWSTLM
jgi:hypothetical protein